MCMFMCVHVCVYVCARACVYTKLVDARAQVHLLAGVLGVAGGGMAGDHTCPLGHPLHHPNDGGGTG